ncbi:MAG: hypothetical protein JSW71_10205, partial [Gemmatimonadota bacterium]
MPWHDATAPPDTDDVGDGDDQIRALKAKLNADLENVAFAWDGAALHPVEGFNRIYYAADAAPPAPPAAYDRSRLWYVSDLGIVRFHDGTNWVELQQLDIRLPLICGIPIHCSAAGWVDYPNVCWHNVAGTVASAPWAA